MRYFHSFVCFALWNVILIAMLDKHHYWRPRKMCTEYSPFHTSALTLHTRYTQGFTSTHNEFWLREIRDFYSPLRRCRRHRRRPCYCCCCFPALGKRESEILSEGIIFVVGQFHYYFWLSKHTHTHGHKPEKFMGYNRPSGIITKRDSLMVYLHN